MFYKKTSKREKIIINISILIAAILISFFVGLYFSQRSETMKKIGEQEVRYIGNILDKYSSEKRALKEDVSFDLYWQVWDILLQEHVNGDDISEKELFYGSLKGMVDSLNDPYSVFMDPILTMEFAEDLSGTFEGIGAEIGIRDGILTIVAPLDDTPAYNAGLMSGDKVYLIDDESTIGITIDEAVKKIRGEKGTDVTLTIFRKGEDETREIVITRGVIFIESVKTSVTEDNIFIARITNFNDDTEEAFNKAVLEIQRVKPKGIILDLRNNPGGYLNTAIEMASEWVEDGVVVIEQIDEDNEFEYLARGSARLKDYKTVVLLNQGSASASEIVAGILKDYKKATLVGEQSFGKGSVQNLKNLFEGSSVKLTIAKWLTPSRQSINDEGITPDEIVELTAEDFEADRDPQMDKAIEIINN